MQVSDPRGLTFEEWSAALVSDNGIAINPGTQDNWQEWAARLYDALNLGLGDMPNPYAGPATDWQGWAIASVIGLEQAVAAPVLGGFASSFGAGATLTYAGVDVPSSFGVLSIWVFINPAGAAQRIFTRGATVNNRFNTVWSDPADVTIAIVTNPPLEQYSGFVTPATPLDNAAWHHVLVNYDGSGGAGSRLIQCAIDGVLLPFTPSFDLGATPIVIDANVDLQLGGGTYGCVGQVWYGQGQSLDLTVPGNIERFVGPGPSSVDLGPIGTATGMAQPTIYLNGTTLLNAGTAGGTFAGGSGACSSGAPS